MTPAHVVQISQQFFWVTLLLAAPALLTSLAVGLLISILQTLTSIQEQTLNFVPRLACVALVVALLAPWLARVATSYTILLLAHMHEIALR